MALQSPVPGTYFEFDQVCNAGALLAFHVHEHRPEKEITRKSSGRKSTVEPVVVDILVLDGGTNPALAKTVVRREEVIGRGITGSLRRVSIGNDGVFRMAWGQGDNGAYPQANAVGEQDMALAKRIFDATNGDPYTAAERAANPTAGLQSPAPVAPPAPAPQYQPPAPPAPVAAPAQPPAPDAPAPWGQGGNTGGNAPAAVGGPQGPGWGESPAATNAQPVASGSVW